MKLDVRNPRTGQVDHVIELIGADELATTVARLRAAQPAWEERGVQHRTAALSAWGDAITARRAELVEALVADTGRLGESHMEVDAVVGSIRRWCAIGPDLLADGELQPASAVPGVEVGQGFRAHPLVGVISPWNFPFLLSVIDAIPALVAGCAVLIKPSEITPRFVDAVAATLADVPDLATVAAYVVGDGSIGAAVVDAVDCVCFTGSVTTGRVVAAQAADRFIPAFLELGGKDAAIVLASADLDRASSAILWGSTANAGQSCQSIERVYVDASVADDFIEQLVAKAEAVALAVPSPADGSIGPIISADQVPIIAAHLDDALAKGAKARTGGTIEIHDGGAYLRPTVLTGVDHTMKVMTEETFGPILPVMAVDGVDAAVAAANETVYGLSAAVFAGRDDEALAVARRLDAGGISINDAALTALVHDGEKQSFKLSGLGGSRMGPAALRRFGRRQAYLVSRATAPDPWWYPSLRS
jgi:acyl-CoA reductase-like NAD-dependent aldehyde dehydrogenase